MMTQLHIIIHIVKGISSECDEESDVHLLFKGLNHFVALFEDESKQNNLCLVIMFFL